VKVYISGPMTGIADHNFPAFRAASGQLRAEGFEVLDPSARGVVAGYRWADYLKADIVMVLAAHAVVVLPGWEKSRGACLEVHIARELGLPVVEMGDLDDLWEMTA